MAPNKTRFSVRIPKVKHPALHNPIEKHFDKITKYHYYIFFFIFLSKIPIFWHVLNVVFLSPPMNFHCVDEEKNISQENMCPCNTPLWNKTVFKTTTQTKFGIYCERDWLISFSQSIGYAGLLVGAFVFGFLSDRYGRLSMFTVCCIILATAGCLVSVMPTVTTFTIMRSIEGIGVGGSIVTSYVICVEYSGIRYRDTIAALYHFPITLSQITVAGISYLIRDCDQFQLALSLPIFLVVGYKCMLMESPKWLMDNDYMDEATVVMKRFCKFNKHPCENIRQEMESFRAHHNQTNRSNIKFLGIFRHKKLSIELGCMSGIYFVCGIGYYGVAQYIGKMSGAIHKNFAISGALLIPGTIACVFLLRVLKRKIFLISTSLLSGFSLITVLIIPWDYSFTRVAIACCSNSFFFMSFIIVYLYSVELFPTSVRNSVVGFLSVLSRLGQTIAPQINSLSEGTAVIVLSVLGLFGAVLCYPLPETKNIELPSSLEDSKNLFLHSNEENNLNPSVVLEGS